MITITSPRLPSSGPSLYKLIDTSPNIDQLHLSSEALAIISRQIETIVEQDKLRADIALGMLRFSIVELHLARLARLAPQCRSLTIYGRADVALPRVPNIQFVPLAPERRLCQEWFMVVDSPGFWGALLTHAQPVRGEMGSGRYQFVGALTGALHLIDRANLLLSLERPRPPLVEGRDQFAQHERWARIAFGLASHSQAGRLGLQFCLREWPVLLELLGNRGLTAEPLLPQALQSLQRHTAATRLTFYRAGAQGLSPAAWSAQLPVPLTPESLAVRAFESNKPLVEPIEGCDAVEVAIPVRVRSLMWGVLCATLPNKEYAPHAAGVAALLGLLLGE